ncbi:ATP synthase subunit d, mitochondrial [Harpegnathos saltator]|uniref:ATP synthase subunit d, mitochondrial n=1 Tax=Harpegnathos saltator TaxID=610380 RepID=E2C543_HARSA|nr:ATP synthase subunit d, mitochondrial [Harpegnathos saltator]EFN76951.1 ATP synthase subunit d, mitochondrial [Harpegnathos saltator]
MSRKAIKAINWAALLEKIPETEKAAYAAFKAKSDQHLRRMAAYPEEYPKIDWAFYKKNISMPGLVDKFQKEYESFSVPYPADKYTSLIEQKEKEILVEMEKFVKESNKNIAKANKEIEKIQNMLPFAEMTMEDFRDAYPEFALDSINKPTIWPHIPEVQPENDPGPPKFH